MDSRFLAWPDRVVGHISHFQVIHLPWKVLRAFCDAATSDCVQEGKIVVHQRDCSSARSELEHDCQSFRVVLGDEYTVADRALAYARLDVVVEGCLPGIVVECSKT